MTGLSGCGLGDAQGSRERKSAQGDPNIAGLWGFGFFMSICFKEQCP